MTGDTRHRNRSRLGRRLTVAAAVLFAFAAFPGAAAARSDATSSDRDATGPVTAQILVFPSMSISPAVGPPGTVALVRGAHFGKTRQITLEWSAGIQYRPLTPVVTRDDGTFTAQVLVVAGDSIYGRRFLTASYNVFVFGRVGPPPAVAQVPFTVVEHSAGPPVAAILRTYWGRRPVILRH